MQPIVASVATIAMLIMSQKPDRVSNILRISTLTSRLRGTPGRLVSIAMAVVLMPWLLRGDFFALGVSGELEEHLLEAGALGGSELDQGHARRCGGLADLLGVDSVRSPPSPEGEALMPAVVSALASADMSPALTNVPAVCSSSPWCPGPRSGRCR